MTIEKKKGLYSLFIRFGVDGSFKAAHATDIVQFIDPEDGASAPKETDPRAVTLAEFGELLGAKNAELIEAADAARAIAGEALAQRDAAISEAAAQRLEIDALRSELEVTKAALAQAQALVAALAVPAAQPAPDTTLGTDAA